MEMNDRNYKDTPEGKKAQQRYADILPLRRPTPIRPPMDLVQRAKIFAPYDALRGFDEAIAAVEETASEVSKEDLSEEQQQNLSDQLAAVSRGMKVQAVFFAPGSSADKGQYVHVTGTVERIDPIAQLLTLHTGESCKSPETPGTQTPLPKSIPLEISFSDLLSIVSQ